MALELKLLVVTASTTLNRATPSNRFRTHNPVVVGSSPTRPTKFNSANNPIPMLNSVGPRMFQLIEYISDINLSWVKFRRA